ncbi:MAG: DNA polymerase V [Flavobacteriales bacterium]|jgi:DNA polymerase V
MIALADCNNFFASCERSLRPELEGKPIIVLSNNDGCIIARSNEVKALVYKMGEPVFKVKDQLLRDKVHVFSANVTLYRAVSQQIMQILASECNAMEVYSIDEAFMDFTDVACPDEKAILLREQVLRETKIPISIGIAKTKVLAKLASTIAKKHTSKGVFLFTDKALVSSDLDYYPVEDLWGVGSRLTKTLNKKGIFNASQLANLNESWLRKYMNIGGVRLVRELNGIPCSDLVETRAAKKSIMNSRSFKKELSSQSELNEILTNFASSCAQKLRNQKSCTQKLCVFIQTNRFKPDAKIHNGYIEVIFPTATNDSIEIIKATHKALGQLYKSDCLYKRAGVIVSDIIPESVVQLSLFSKHNIVKRTALMKVCDSLNSKMGQGTLRLSVQGTQKQWNSNKEPIAFGN